MEKKISVFLSDWQVLFREGMHFTLCDEEDMEVIGEGTSSEEALNFVETNSPDVAILSMRSGKLSGVEAARCIKRNSPPVAVILVTDHDDPEHLFSAVKCGASAYLTKDADPMDLVNTIRKVVQGENLIIASLLIPGIASKIIADFELFASVNEQVDCLFAHLTAIEADILYRIAKGNTIEHIVGALSITRETAEYNLGLILSKLITNDHNRQILEIMQKGLPSISSIVRPPTNYVTKEEFNNFRENLGEQLKSIIGELD